VKGGTAARRDLRFHQPSVSACSRLKGTLSRERVLGHRLATQREKKSRFGGSFNRRGKSAPELNKTYSSSGEGSRASMTSLKRIKVIDLLSPYAQVRSFLVLRRGSADKELPHLSGALLFFLLEGERDVKAKGEKRESGPGP